MPSGPPEAGPPSSDKPPSLSSIDGGGRQLIDAHPECILPGTVGDLLLPRASWTSASQRLIKVGIEADIVPGPDGPMVARCFDEREVEAIRFSSSDTIWRLSKTEMPTDFDEWLSSFAHYLHDSIHSITLDVKGIIPYPKIVELLNEMRQKMSLLPELQIRVVSSDKNLLKALVGLKDDLDVIVQQSLHRYPEARQLASLKRHFQRGTFLEGIDEIRIPPLADRHQTTDALQIIDEHGLRPVLYATGDSNARGIVELVRRGFLKAFEYHGDPTRIVGIINYVTGSGSIPHLYDLNAMPSPRSSGKPPIPLDSPIESR